MQEYFRPFSYERIVQATPGTHNDVCLLTDLTGNGWLDIIIGGKYGRNNLCWYEAPHWACHTIGEAYLEAGGLLVDITGNGRLDLVAGEALGNQSRREGGGYHLFWWEQPADPREPWKQRVIENGFHKYHNQAAGDVDGDKEPEIVIASQFAGIVAYYDIPEDLECARWPYSVRHIVCANLSDEGVAVGDVNGDGQNEIIVSTNVFALSPDRRWHRRQLADFDRPAIALGDLSGNGIPEIVAAEGERSPARLAWFDALSGEMRLLADDLFHPHSLAVADFTGNGCADIFVGEMGLGIHKDPRLIIYINEGAGKFTPVVISKGHPTHNAAVGDVNGDGHLDIVGKPYHPGNWVDIWWNTWS